jgi:hypothetical protein
LAVGQDQTGVWSPSYCGVVTTDIVTAIVAGASAIGGGLVVARSNYAIGREQGRVAHNAELRRMLSLLLHVRSLMEHQLQTEPVPKAMVRTINKELKRFPQLDYNLTRTRRRIFEPHMDSLIDRFFGAMSATVLIAPPELLARFEAVADLMSEVTPEDPSWFDRWATAQGELVAASRFGRSHRV